MDHEGRVDLTRRVAERADAAHRGDADAVRGEQAVAEAEALLDHIDGTPDSPDMHIQFVAGLLYWNRWCVLGDDDIGSARRAELLLTPLYFVDPTSLPAQLVEYVEARLSPPEAGDTGRLHDIGRALATLGTELHRPVFLDPAVQVLDAAVAQSTDETQRLSCLSLLGEVLLHRYDARGGAADLDRAVVTLRAASRLAPADEGAPVALLNRLGRALVVTAQLSDDPAPLQEAVEVSRRALPHAGADDRDEAIDVAVGAVNAAAGRPVRDAAAALAFVPEVVAAAQEALAASTPEDPLHALRTAQLAMALDHLENATDEAVRLACAAVHGLAPGTAERRSALTVVVNRLVLDAESPLGEETFRIATTTMLELAAGSRPEDSDHAVHLVAKAAAFGALNARGDSTVNRSHFEEAVRELAAGAPAQTSVAQLLIVIGHDTAHWNAHNPGNPLDDPEKLALLEALADTLRASLAQVPLNRGLVPKWLTDLAMLLRQRVGWRPEPAVIEEAIEVHRRLLAVRGPDAGSGLTLDLAFLLGTRSATTGDLGAATEAAALADRVLQGADLDPAVRDRAFAISGSALLDLAKATPDPAVARRAEAAFRSLGDSEEPAVWHNLATTRWLQYERTGAGLSDAIAAARRATALGEGRPRQQQDERVAFLAQLLATDGQFDEALGRVRRVGTSRDGEPPSATVLDALGAVLHGHHVRFGGAAELDESIAALRSALRTGDPTPVRLITLASALRGRYTATGDLASLEEAIAAGRQALCMVPADHDDTLRIQSNLVVQLVEHHRRTGDNPSLTEAIRTGRDVVAATAPGHPERAMRLSNLAISLLDLQRSTGSASTAVEAERVAGEAVTATPADHPSLARRLLGQANAVANAGWPGRGRIRRAARIARTAARLPSAPPSNRLAACRAWGGYAAALRDWDAAAEAFAEGVRLLPRLAGRNLTRSDAEHQLAGIGGVHVDAAACAVLAGDPAAAVTLLEQGRGVLLSYALDTRTELTDLHAAAPELGAEVERLVGELDAVSDPLIEEEGRPAALDDRHTLVGRWDTVLAQVRALPGFERFAAPPAIDDLLPAGANGPVVIVNVSEHDCDALVVTPDGVRVVPLPRLTAAAAGTRATAFLAALDLVGTGDLAQRMDGQAAVRETLAWLWDTVAEPVLDALGHTRAPRDGTPWPRVWWSPTGLLNFLPLHAAGHHDQPGRAVLDRVVSSYTPTLRALQHARSRPPVPDPAPLAVAMSQTPGQPSLPAVVVESQALGRDDVRTLRLSDAAAQHDAVVAALPDHGWVHFACHAVSDPLQPSESRLLLHDRPLAVRDIGRLRLRNAELAFLAACSTARGSEQLADEAIHIASAFQLAGYRNVVGTLWPALDATAARVSQGFYAEQRRLGAAEALHTVVRQLRSEQPLVPSAWACYVHAGP